MLSLADPYRPLDTGIKAMMVASDFRASGQPVKPSPLGRPRHITLPYPLRLGALSRAQALNLPEVQQLGRVDIKEQKCDDP